jgi:hypothetical protein
MKTKPVQEVFTENGYLNVVTSQTVETRNILRVKTSDNKYETLEVKIIADFSTIDEKYHEIFFNIISAKYLQSVSFGDNPFSQCQPPPKKRWWEFWKANLNI